LNSTVMSATAMLLLCVCCSTFLLHGGSCSNLISLPFGVHAFTSSAPFRNSIPTGRPRAAYSRDEIRKSYNSPIRKRPHILIRSMTTNNDSDLVSGVDSEAKEKEHSEMSESEAIARAMMEEAKRMRKEAEEMSVALTRERIAGLQKMLKGLGKSSEEEPNDDDSKRKKSDLQSRISELQERLNNPPSSGSNRNTVTEAPVLSDEKFSKLVDRVTDEEKDIEVAITVNNEQITTNSSDDESWLKAFLDSDDIANLKSRNTTIEELTKEFDEALKEIPLMKRMVESLGDMTGKDNVTIEELLASLKGVNDANETFASIIQDEMTFNSAFPDVVTDTDLEGFTKEDVDGVFLSHVLSRDVFRPTSKPIRVPGGFYIVGVNQKATGDQLIEKLDERMKEYFSESHDKVQINYIRDLKSFIDMDEMQLADALSQTELATAVMDFESMLGGALYITTKNMKPAFPPIFRYSLSMASLVTVALFATSCYIGVPDADVIDLLTVNNILFGLSTPLFAAMLGIQLAHEAGHGLIALIRGVRQYTRIYFFHAFLESLSFNAILAISLI
jgi:hypothetical protein